MVLLSGVRTDRRAEPLDEGSALTARREGVTTVILVGASAGVRGVDMAGGCLEVELGQLDPDRRDRLKWRAKSVSSSVKMQKQLDSSISVAAIRRAPVDRFRYWSTVSA